MALLHKAAILDRFAVLVCGDEVAKGKPAPDIYLAAASALGVCPNHCVAFEDSSNGVRAAVAAGLITVQVPDLVAPPADIVALGHVIAPDVLTGARHVGCL
jgi:beta-phosphoglucomutase-like phosphatase (HAD superfamily)